MYVNKIGIFKSKGHDNMRWYEFCLGSVSKDFEKNEQSEISFNGTVYDFSPNHSSVEKEDVLSQYPEIFNGWEYYETTFGLNEQIFIDVLTSVGSVSNHTKCKLVRNQKCMSQTILTDLDPIDLLTYSAIKVRYQKASEKEKKKKS